MPCGSLFALPARLFQENGAVEDPSELATLQSHLSVLAVGMEEDPEPGRHESGATCNACGIKHFSSVEVQREHFKTDWHRYNIKRRLAGGPVAVPLSEVQFEALVSQDAGEVGSLSGSESEESEDEKEGPGRGGSSSSANPFFSFSVEGGQVMKTSSPKGLG